MRLIEEWQWLSMISSCRFPDKPVKYILIETLLNELLISFAHPSVQQ